MYHFPRLNASIKYDRIKWGLGGLIYDAGFGVTDVTNYDRVSDYNM